VVSNVVFDHQRTVTIVRHIVGRSTEHFTFNAKAGQLKFISATGMISSAEEDGPSNNVQLFAHHSSKSANTLHMLPEGVPTCLCDTVSATDEVTSESIKGSINGKNFVRKCFWIGRGGELPYTKDSKISTLYDEHNSACSARTYRGGIDCCSNGVILLDREQIREVPKTPSTFMMKFR
jgi:tRNA-binding EMAP/Myf-like protein